MTAVSLQNLNEFALLWIEFNEPASEWYMRASLCVLNSSVKYHCCVTPLADPRKYYIMWMNINIYIRSYV